MPIVICLSPAGASGIQVVGVTGQHDADDVNVPAGTQDGDVVYVFVSNNTETPAGYTLLSSSGGLKCYRKFYTGETPPSQLDFGNNNEGEQIAISLRGVNPSTPEDATPTVASGSGQVEDSPAITTVTAGTLIISVFLQDSTFGGFFSSPSGYTNVTQVTNANLMGLATQLQTTAGSKDPPAWSTIAGEVWTAMTVAVRPAT